jgi:hypothetical protein
MGALSAACELGITTTIAIATCYDGFGRKRHPPMGWVDHRRRGVPPTVRLIGTDRRDDVSNHRVDWDHL